MKQPFKIGDIQTYHHLVKEADFARFPSGQVHPVYSTFALTRDAEWVCRKFVLEMKEEEEEGIGTFVEVRHQSPALEGQEVIFTATLEEVNGHAVICSFQACVGNRVVAEGRTGQKILLRTKINALFAALQ